MLLYFFNWKVYKITYDVYLNILHSEDICLPGSFYFALLWNQYMLTEISTVQKYMK